MISHGSTRRIVVTGSEGTGKTTLARQLATHFDAPWVPEFARAYAESVGRPLGPSDVEPIAHGQLLGEDAVLASHAPLVVLDTDMVSTLVYAQHYYGHAPEWLAEVARARLADLYLLLATDTEWQADGVRDQPHARQTIHARFHEVLRELGAPVIEIRGHGTSRFDSAVKAMQQR